jgi:methionyl-tRNA formyltransferase
VADGGKLFVACGADTALEVLELQPAGKRRMSTRDFLRGNPLPPSASIGSEST